MNISVFRKLVTSVKAASLLPIAALGLGLTGCGGGGGGGDSSPATIRPKTLDGIVLSLDTNATLEFIRNTGTLPAVSSGDVETGSFTYTPSSGYNTIRAYDNVSGDRSNTRYPVSVSGATYTYRAINESSGELTLTGTGTIGGIYNGLGFVILNDSWIRLFVTTSPAVGGSVSRIVKMVLTFTPNGSTYVTSDTATLSLPDSALVSTLDTIRVPTAIKLATGGFVPENYNPVVDPLAPSKIAPKSLSGLLMVATNGTPDPTKDFTLQLVADATGITGPPNSNQPDEVGRVTLSVYDTSIPPKLEVVTNAANYTWTRIGGTDKGTFVVSGIPDVVLLPFDNSINGTYSLNFLGTQSGTYTGVVDADTLNALDVTGSFIIR